MKQTRWLFSALAVFLAMLIVLVACQKDISSSGGEVAAGQSKLKVYLTDGPNDFQKVLIDIQQIVVKVDTCNSSGRHDDDDDDDDHHDGDHHDDDDDDDHHDSVDCDIWDTLSINPGVYDLLALQNGVDTLLASGYIPNGEIEKIKFVLGTNNSVLVDSVSYPLNLRDGINFVYLKINHHTDIDSLTAGNLELYLDFDLSRSIKFINGKYWLKPVLKPFCRGGSGEIEGKIRPVNSHGMVAAINGTDTTFARPDRKEGEFKIRGLNAGTYSLYVDGINGYRDTTITNIIVRKGKETELGRIELKK
jgi:Domain of unknown function (DUF4382)